jgi:hypothetical protein
MFASRDTAAGYLAAMIDGEGTVGLYRKPWVSRAIRITNTERTLIDACSEACLLLGIEHSIDDGRALRSGKTSWTLTIGKTAALSIVADCVPLRSARKSATLAEALATARPDNRPSREVLEQLYVFEDRSAGEIGRLLGASPRSVRTWLRAEGVPIRDRSTASRRGWETRRAET